MNHVKLRRIALTAASVSMSVLTALVLIGSSIDAKVSAQSILVKEVDYTQSQEKNAPVAISCTPLIIQKMASYDGKFIEDGSGRQVQDVAAIVLFNNRDTIVPYAFVTVYTDHCRYTFSAYMIPPKSSVLVPEENGQKLTETGIVRTFGWTTVARNQNQIRLSFEEVGMNCLRVTNQTGSKVKNVVLYHRTYMSENDLYIGGKAFETKISYIAPGESVLVYPDNYASGYSKIVYFE